MKPGHYHSPQFRPAPGSPAPPPQPQAVKTQLEATIPQEAVQAFVDSVFDNLGETQRVEPKPRRRGSAEASQATPEPLADNSPSEQPKFMGTLSVTPGRISMGQWRVNPYAVARDLGILRR